MELHHKLLDKVSLLPLAKGKEIVAVLFLKYEPKDSAEGLNIMYPQDVIDAVHGD